MYTITCDITASGVDLTNTANTGSCIIFNLSSGGIEILTIPGGSSSVVSSQIFVAANYKASITANFGKYSLDSGRVAFGFRAPKEFWPRTERCIAIAQNNPRQLKTVIPRPRSSSLMVPFMGGVIGKPIKFIYFSPFGGPLFSNQPVQKNVLL